MAGALLFALHPLQVEAVAWVTGLKDVLGGIFTLGSLLLYIIAVERADSPARSRRWLYFALSTLVYAVALLSKPSATCMPLMVLIAGRLMFRRPWKEILPLVALWSAMAIVPIVLTRTSQLPGLAFQAKPELRPFIALDAAGFYLEKLLCPVALAIDQGRARRGSCWTARCDGLGYQDWYSASYSG